MKVAEEIESLVGKFFEGGEVMVSGDSFVIKVPEPFNEIEVGRISRHKVKFNSGMVSFPLHHLLGVIIRGIVEKNMEFAMGVLLDQFVE